MTLHELQRRFKGFDIRAEAAEVVKETAWAIKMLNQKQLKAGIGSDSGPLINILRGSTSYSPAYGRWRLTRGLQVDHYDLRVTGRWWEGLKVDVNSQTFNVVNTDPKTSLITTMFGEEPMGLTEESKLEEYVPNYFLPALRERIRLKLGI